MKRQRKRGHLAAMLVLAMAASACSGCVDISDNFVDIRDNDVLSNNENNGNGNLSDNKDNGNGNGSNNEGNLNDNAASADGTLLAGDSTPSAPMDTALPDTEGPTTDEAEAPPAPSDEDTATA